MDNPLAELVAWDDAAYDDGNVNAIVTSFVDRDEDCRLTFRTTDDAGAQAEWTLITGGREETVWRDEYGWPEWHETHVLLLPHLDRRAWVSLAKPLADPMRAWGAVAKAHHDLVGDWFPLGRTLRASMMNERFGVLAQGAERVVATYADALTAIGEEIGFASQDRARAVGDPPPTLVTWGRSYFIARSFRLERTG